MPKKINIKGPIVSNDTAWLYEYFGWDAASPSTLAKGLEEAAGEDVILEINSPGGVCVYGYEMYTAIKEYEGKVTAHVISAMSAATLLVCAADEALISDTGIFMIHNTQSTAQGDYRDMEMTADALREFNAGIINAYVKKTGKSREEMQELMDKDSYMSPQKAIEIGFIDGYMFREPQPAADAGNFVEGIVAAGMQIIPEDKAREVIQAVKGNLTKADEKVAPVQQVGQNIGETAVSDKSQEGGENKMLKEFLKENPEAQAEFDIMIAEAKAEAKAEGKKEERARMQSLDAISATVTSAALHEAKYGENPIDGPTLAYQAMVDGEKLAKAYMAAAVKDAENSGSNSVGIGMPDAGQEQTDESDEMAAYVNKTKGGN